jgi:hypothetical protein
MEMEQCSNPSRESSHESGNEQGRGRVDLVSVLYVLCGIPAMIVVFLILFGLVGACDQANVYIPA